MIQVDWNLVIWRREAVSNLLSHYLKEHTQLIFKIIQSLQPAFEYIRVAYLLTAMECSDRWLG